MVSGFVQTPLLPGDIRIITTHFAIVGLITGVRCQVSEGHNVKCQCQNVSVRCQMSAGGQSVSGGGMSVGLSDVVGCNQLSQSKEIKVKSVDVDEVTMISGC